MERLFRFKFVLLAIVLAVGCWIYVSIVGDEYVAKVDLNEPLPYEAGLTASVTSDSVGFVDVGCVTVTGNTVCVPVKAVRPGRVYLEFNSDEDIPLSQRPGLVVLYVHKSGLITQNDYFGIFNGAFAVRLCVFVYLVLVMLDLLYRYMVAVRENMYQYRCILLAGILLFMAGPVVNMGLSLFLNYRVGLIDIPANALEILGFIALLTLPAALALSVLTMVSNIKLMIREGRSLRNMLGFFLGVALLVAAVLPSAVSRYLQNSSIIDVHKWSGPGRFIGMFIENVCGSASVYFVCILVGTIVLGVKAARHVPSFDKDYILILGCQIRKDGSLTKLLQSRADRAVEFSRMQKEATGKDIIFVPSGGKGSDEVIAEGEAIKNYLLSIGIPASQILAETRSTTTRENILLSSELIKSAGGDCSKVALSTTNYHVFRAGMLASTLGIKMEGIGSKTKRYFWVNAFIREFVATLVSERKKHAAVLGTLVLISALVAVMNYISTGVLS